MNTSGKKGKINKDSPRYAEYDEKWHRLEDIYLPQIDEEDEKFKDFIGLDCPPGSKKNQLHKSFVKELVQLQEEYKDLFEEVKNE